MKEIEECNTNYAEERVVPARTSFNGTRRRRKPTNQSAIGVCDADIMR
jgi:hypothetical protein